MLRPVSIFFLASAFSAAFAFDPSTQDDSAALARHFKDRPNPVESTIQQGSFVPLEGETISLMGGTDVYRMQYFGFLEAALQSAFPEKKLHVRNIGWPADTVYRQQRPMYFYTEEGDTREDSIPDQREKIDPGTFMMMFGRMESLDGLAALPQFEAAYRSLIERLKQYSGRLILIGPPSFAKAGPAASQAGERNVVLEKYTEVIEELAGRNGAAFVSLSGLDAGGVSGEMEYLEMASEVADGLGFDAVFDGDVVDAVLEKNHLWHQYYRPTNWGFLFGDRQWVPSSRGHEDAERRWFVEELAKLSAMIEEADEKIWEVAR